MTETPADATRPDDPDGIGEVVEDYSRVGFRKLQALCKARNIPADGTGPQLIEKLKAWDAQRGTSVDTSLPDEPDPPTDDEPDLLADEDIPAPPDSGDNPSHATDPALQQPPVGGEAASASPTGGQHPHRSPATPAIVVQAAEGEPGGLPRALIRHGVPNMAAKSGPVKVGEAHGAAEVRAFRAEFPVYGEINDVDHFRFIAEAHHLAWAAGLATKGGVTVGERVGFSTDADGRRTAIYQVPLKRAR